MSALWRDFRYAARALARSPGFTAVAIVILGLGIGANSTIFSLVNTLFLTSPPGIASPERLVRVNRSTEYTRSGSLAYPDYAFYRDNNAVFSGFAAQIGDGGDIAVMVGNGRANAQAEVSLVTGNYFDVLGVAPALGRTLLPADDVVDDPSPVVVLGHRFWLQSFGADPEVVGQVIELNGHPFEVVGVAAESFHGISPFASGPDLWTPITMRPVLMPGEGEMFRRLPGEIQVWLQGIGRLRHGVEVETAESNMTALARRLEVEYAEWNEGVGVALTSNFQYHPSVRARLAGLTRLLMAAVAAVLLIACANLAILLLARISARERELGVRRALGAGRGRVLSALLAEGLVLALAGGLVGLALAIWSTDLAASLLPVSVEVPLHLDLRVVGFTLALCAVTAIVFALAPAWTAAGWDIAEVIKGGSRVTRQSRSRSALVVAQVALAIVLVSGAVLFLRSFVAAQTVDIGFATANRAVLQFDLRRQGHDEAEGKRYILSALERVRAVPGIVSVTTTRMVPLGRGVWSGSFIAEGVEPPEGADYFDTGFNSVGPDYFETLRIPLLSGRGFTLADDDRAPGVVVVNEALAAMVWPGENPVGKRVGRGEGEWFTVVGLARNANYYELGESPQPQMYLPVLQHYQSRVNVLVQASGDAAAALRPVEAELRALDPRLVVSQAQTLDDVFASTLGSYRVLAILVGLFGSLALVLAALGLYGVLSYLVTQRTREVGIRVALGARATQVVGMILSRGIKLSLIGIAIGTLVAWGAARSVRGFLFGISPHDTATFVVVPLILALVAVVAAYLPARRAAAIDPTQAIRSE